MHIKQIKIGPKDEKLIIYYPAILSCFFYAFFGDYISEYIYEENDSIISKWKFNLPWMRNQIDSQDISLYEYNFSLKEILRASIRSAYQLINPRSKTIGLFELFILVLRNTILLDVEKHLINSSFYMIHGALLSKGNSTIILVGKSGSGKSTFSKVLEEHGWQCYGDNYVFINNNMAMTIPECQRFGQAKRFKFSFYGKNVGFPKKTKPINWSSIILLEKNSNADIRLLSLSIEATVDEIIKISLQENEGIVNQQLSKYIKGLTKLKKQSNSKTYRLIHGANIEKTKEFIKSEQFDQI